MATSAYAPTPSPYRPLRAPTATNPIGFVSSTDPRKATQNQRATIQGQGDALQANDADLANQYAQQAGGVEDYLNPIENTMATGNGGYNADETRQIQYSPEEQQDLIDKAGISAGVGTAATVGAAQRAAAAVGGSPGALATYRARAAQDMAANAGDAMTGARVQAKQLESQGAQTTGNARLGQQNTALNYYSGLQSQKNQNSLGEQGLQQGAYQTETGGTNAATGDVLKASQTPSLTDKIVGGAAGVAKAFLADGDLGGGYDAVLGEDGPEAIIEGASDPVRSDTRFMADGMDGEALPTQNAAYSPDYAPAVNNISPFRDYLNRMKSGGAQSQPAPKDSWNPTTPWSQAGEAIGGGLKAAFMADGAVSDVHYPVDDYLSRVGGDAGVHKSIADEEAYMRSAGEREQNNRRAGDSRGFGDWAHDDMQKSAESAMRMRRAAGSTPAHPGPGKAPAHMANGGVGIPRQVTNYRPRPAMPPKIITSPTRVHLNKGDSVVPLSYRPMAKIRPSALMGDGHNA